MSQTDIIIDLCAAVFARVRKFQAVRDVRYYLLGVHVVPGAPVRLEATDGYRLFIQEDLSGTATRECILKVGKRGHALLREGNRVRVSEDGRLTICSEKGAVLYVDPESAFVEGKFPRTEGLFGKPEDYTLGIRDTFNLTYIKEVSGISGCVVFFTHRDTNKPLLFCIDGSSGAPNGGRACGLIMPVRATISGDSENQSPRALMPGSLLRSAESQEAEGRSAA